MLQYLKVENLKLKRTLVRKLLVIAPVITILLAYGIGGIINFQPQVIYWWYSFILPGTTALICTMFNQKETVSTKYYLIFSSDISVENTWLAKVSVIAIYVLLSGMILLIPIYYINLRAPAIALYSTGSAFLGIALIALTSLWQIPLCLALAHKLGMVVPILANAFMGMFTPVLFANQPLWFLCPYCWPPKLMEVVLGIKSNGAVMEEKVSGFFYPAGGSIFLSLVLFIIILITTRKWFQSLEVG